MLSNEARKMFKVWKLYEKEWTAYTIFHYEHPLIKMEWIFKKNDRKEKNKMYDLIFNLFFEYERNWKPLTTYELWYITGCDHSTMVKSIKKVLWRIRESKESKQLRTEV